MLDKIIERFNRPDIEQNIEGITSRATEVMEKKLAVSNSLIEDIKKAVAKGMDKISMEQLQEWAIVIPIICEELVPHREVFALTRDLWDIEVKQLSAKNLLELDLKKTEIDNINRVAGTENAKKKAIADYMAKRLSGTAECLWTLSNGIRKMIDVRIARGNFD